MYVFSADEKQSMHKLLNYFVVMGRYKSTAILKRMDEDSLTKRDLGSIQKKLTLAIHGLGSFTVHNTDDFNAHMEISKWISIVDSALFRYRIIGWRNNACSAFS